MKNREEKCKENREENREENRGKSVTWHVAMKLAKREAPAKKKLGRMLDKLAQRRNLN